jgi:5'(3')-deoxyribonucleotidase
MKKLTDVRYLSDMDDTIVALMRTWVELYFRQGGNLRAKECMIAARCAKIVTWDIDRYFSYPDYLWEVLPEALRIAKPNAGILAAVKALGDQMSLVTTTAQTCDRDQIVFAKLDWILNNWDNTGTTEFKVTASSAERAALPGDVLIDDNPDNLQAWLDSRPDRTVVCVNMPHNKNWRELPNQHVFLVNGTDLEPTVTETIRWAADRHLELFNMLNPTETIKPVDAQLPPANAQLPPAAKPEPEPEPMTHGGWGGDDLPQNVGVKHDTGKAPLWWVPRETMEGIANVMEFGAQKYKAHNWRKGMKWTRLASAALRHLTAWCNGEDKDPETGYSHLWHAACDIAFLISYETRKLGEDDRGF